MDIKDCIRKSEKNVMKPRGSGLMTSIETSFVPHKY